MRDILTHCKRNIIRGVFASIPLAVTVFVLYFIYTVIDKRIVRIVDHYLGIKGPGIGFCLLLFLLYFVGLIASNVIGRRFFALLEQILEKIPLIKTTYHVGKQLSVTLSLPERQVFQRAVLIDFFRPDSWVIGFVTGTVNAEGQGEPLLKIFIPTVPNPTSGYLVLARKSRVIDPGWSIEEAVKTVISGGIIGPSAIRTHLTGG